MVCAGHPRFPGACRGEGDGFAGRHLSYGYSGQNAQCSHLHGLMCPQHTNLALPRLSSSWGSACSLPWWTPGSLGCFFTRSFPCSQVELKCCYRSGPCPDLIIPKSWLLWGINAFLPLLLVSSAPSDLAWVQPRWRCCCGSLQGCSWESSARGTSLMPRNLQDTKGVLLLCIKLISEQNEKTEYHKEWWRVKEQPL